MVWVGLNTIVVVIWFDISISKFKIMVEETTLDANSVSGDSALGAVAWTL